MAHFFLAGDTCVSKIKCKTDCTLFTECSHKTVCIINFLLMLKMKCLFCVQFIK